MQEFTIFSNLHQPLLKKIREIAHQILSLELKAEVKRERFYWGNYWIPLSFSIFEGKNAGRCIPWLFQIGINIRVLNSGNWPVITDILRHEIAHLITFLEYPDCPRPHGVEFNQICLKYFSKEVAKASINLEEIFNQKDQEQIEKTISKVQKLFSLAQSSNNHEALLAIQKANQILLQFNINLDIMSEDQTYMLSVISGKRCQEKHQAIAKIIQEFYVAPIFSHAKNKFFLHVVGSKANVQFADYLAVYLDRELERLWEITKGSKKTTIRAKNSFFRGIAVGFLKKMSDDKANLAGVFIKEEKMQLATVLKNQEKELLKHLDRAFPKRRSSFSQSITDHSWSEVGKSAGEKLSFNRPLENNNTKSGPLYFLK